MPQCPRDNSPKTTSDEVVIWLFLSHEARTSTAHQSHQTYLSALDDRMGRLAATVLRSHRPCAQCRRRRRPPPLIPSPTWSLPPQVLVDVIRPLTFAPTDGSRDRLPLALAHPARHGLLLRAALLPRSSALGTHSHRTLCRLPPTSIPTHDQQRPRLHLPMAATVALIPLEVGLGTRPRIATTRTWLSGITRRRRRGGAVWHIFSTPVTLRNAQMRTKTREVRTTENENGCSNRITH